MTTITLTRTQLILARSLKQGWPATLLSYCLSRAGAEQADWDGLAAAGLVELRADGRWWLTKAGKRQYNRDKQGCYF